MAAEMAEQPRVLTDLVTRREAIVSSVRAVLPQPLRAIVLIARGSSDHAAVYGRYALEAACGVPVALAAPSLHTLYRVPADYAGCLAVAMSQSGRTPEIVTVLDRLQEHGATGVAVTNDTASPLAEVADVVVAMHAGEERAVPATKTFTAQLAVLAFLAEAVGQPPWRAEEWASVPAAVQEVLDDASVAEDAVDRIGGAPGLVVVGRGYLYASALETALKLKETASVLAHGYSAADLRHGPIAVVERDFPALVLATPGPTWDDLQDLVGLLRERGARVVRVAPGGDLTLPATPSEPLVPLPVAVRGQQLARSLALRRGFDPDSPEGLRKITPTR
ncbi:MAG TPA: SIS domain-containing protein [Egibacteraceae bacterium]|nr:SIS domain-containing protein [Egibacteraceae bacterium]